MSVKHIKYNENTKCNTVYANTFHAIVFNLFQVTLKQIRVKTSNTWPPLVVNYTIPSLPRLPIRGCRSRRTHSSV